jgi:hypothetical protein
MIEIYKSEPGKPEIYKVTSSTRVCYLEASGRTNGLINQIKNNPKKLSDFLADLDSIGTENAIRKFNNEPPHVPKTEAQIEEDEVNELAALFESGDFRGAARKALGLNNVINNPK